MKSAGQNVPDFPYTLMGQVYSLRRSLIEEEALECLQAFAEYNRNRGDEETTIGVLKELADVLVVVYGAFVAMGVDGDQAFRITLSVVMGRLKCLLKRKRS
jgi:predicted HAD superfamily Cof-like phosphohydrolase